MSKGDILILDIDQCQRLLFVPRTVNELQTSQYQQMHGSTGMYFTCN